MRTKDARQEQSVFLKRQTVRRHRDWTRKLRQVERALLAVVLVFAGVGLLYGLYLVVFLGDTFAVRRIIVDGEWRALSAQGLAELSGVKEGDNLFWISVGEVHERLRADPWVKATAVRRRLPDTLWIYVEEHAPAAILASGAGLFYVDSEGTPFKRVEATDGKDYPVFTGVELGEDTALSGEDALRVREMLRLIGLFRASQFGRERDVAEIHYDRMTGYALVTRAQPMQILFGQAALADRMAELDRLRTAIGSREGRIQYMLANEPGRIIVKYQTS